jgi:hypothetical protein
MNDHSYALLQAIGDCHRRMKQHAFRLKENKNVREVKHVVDIPGLPDAVRIEEYVDAELVSGEAISWYLEITVTAKHVRVEADVSRVHSGGQDLICTIDESLYTTEMAALDGLPLVAIRLCSWSPAELS